MTQHTPAIHKSRGFKFYLAAAGLILLLIGLIASVRIGAADIHLSTIWQSFFFFDASMEKHLMVVTLRLPRAILALIVGSSLALAGALMQAMTRNPLASPQIFGINAGASLIVVFSIVFFPSLPAHALLYAAFLGATLGGMIVYAMASGGGMTPVKLALSGMAVHLFLSSLSEGLIMFNEHTTESVLYWLVGAVDGATWDDVKRIFPWFAGGLLGTIWLARPITIFVLGDELAKGMGQRTEWVRMAAGVLVIILAGSSVAIAGPIGFIGLVIPHITRKLVGEDYRAVLPFSALLGAILLVYADIASRFIAYPFESPVGIVTAMIGAPYFLYLARQGRRMMK